MEISTKWKFHIITQNISYDYIKSVELQSLEFSTQNTIIKKSIEYPLWYHGRLMTMMCFLYIFMTECHQFLWK